MHLNVATFLASVILGLAVSTQAASEYHWPRNAPTPHNREKRTIPWVINTFNSTQCSGPANVTSAEVGMLGCEGICMEMSSSFSSVLPAVALGTWELELFSDKECDVPSADYILDATSTTCGLTDLSSTGAASFRMRLLGGLNDVTCD